MIANPYVGQKVTLNEYGMKQIGGLKTRDAFKQSQDMTIMAVDNVVLTVSKGINVFDIEVDKPEINMFLLDNLMVDPL